MQERGWEDKYLWWQRDIIYEIYHRSFLDTTGNGCGDLNGICQQLPYLQWLGIPAIWIAPFYPSPMKDFGYDVTDYTGVHPLFGTMKDFDRLLETAHTCGIRVILDLVPNHTSDQHPWFRESASSRNNGKQDWYLWCEPGQEEGPPNNWLSEFGGSAWQWYEGRQQYYYHAFLPEQPDLNLRNPDVRQAIYAVMRFWLDKGVDGFRIDVMWHMVKDAQLRNNPPNPDYREGVDSPYDRFLPVYSTDQPEVHDVVKEMRSVINEYEHRIMIGEIYLPIDALMNYYGDANSEAHLPFNFQLIHSPWDAGHIRRIVDTYEASLPPGAWPNWVIGNHDQHRIATRIGPLQARAAAMLLLTLRGTPTMYYGDEIGMHDVEILPEKTVDPRERRCPGLGLGRDPQRTPMQWSDEPGAGFTEGEPWLPVALDFKDCNVEHFRKNPASILCLYKRLIHLRQSEPALAIGRYSPLDMAPPLFGFLRQDDHNAFAVILNFADEPQMVEQRMPLLKGKILISTLDADVEHRNVEGVIHLKAYEGSLVKLDEVPDTPLH
jgi:alpha-glucosidase